MQEGVGVENVVQDESLSSTISYFFLTGLVGFEVRELVPFLAVVVAVFLGTVFEVSAFFGGFADVFETFATFVLAETAGVEAADLPDAAGTGFLLTSLLTTFAGFGASFGAGGLAGFFFGGSCNSAKRVITSAIDCSDSA